MSDQKIRKIERSLNSYIKAHARAKITVRRKNAVTVWIRVVDPDFKGQSRADRHDALWTYIDKLPYELRQDISVLLPVTPAESKKRLLSQEFDEQPFADE
jgi:hypothetical protein